MRPPAVLTNCTSRKRQGAQPITLPKGQYYGSVERAAEAWRSIHKAAPKLRLVRDLYLGRSFADAYTVSRGVGGELFVVSAGLGLAHELDEAPSYDLTFADAANPLAQAIASSDSTPADWWRALNCMGVGHGPVAKLVAQRSPGLVMLALPSGYLEMLVPDLLDIGPESRQSLRIFSSTAGVLSLPKELQEFALPYDDRLESLPGHDGTRVDFPQRAMRHFVEEIRGHELDIGAAKARVAEALSGLSPRLIPARTKLSDSDIAAVLRAQWKRHKGSSSQLLRFLRQEAQIACEQKRFRNIWQALKAEQAAQGVRV